MVECRGTAAVAAAGIKMPLQQHGSCPPCHRSSRHSHSGTGAVLRGPQTCACTRPLTRHVSSTRPTTCTNRLNEKKLSRQQWRGEHCMHDVLDLKRPHQKELLTAGVAATGPVAMARAGFARRERFPTASNRTHGGEEGDIAANSRFLVSIGSGYQSMPGWALYDVRSLRPQSHGFQRSV